jgi:hypothetical protein
VCLRAHVQVAVVCVVLLALQMQLQPFALLRTNRQETVGNRCSALFWLSVVRAPAGLQLSPLSLPISC